MAGSNCGVSNDQVVTEGVLLCASLAAQH